MTPNLQFPQAHHHHHKSVTEQYFTQTVMDPSELKPILRGQFHRVAFFAYLFFSIYLLSSAHSGLPRISLALYLITVVNMYGISSILHITHWKTSEIESRVQRVDHASIFILIAGTYTPLCLNCLPRSESWPTFMLVAAWIIAIAGVLKCLAWHNTRKVFNVTFYFISGLTILPFAPKLVQSISWTNIVFCAAGGILYLAGGTIFGIEYPDPKPTTFGFHEIFHVLTIAANICFMIPICSCILKWESFAHILF